MSSVLLIDHAELDFNVRSNNQGMAYVARALSNEVSPNMGVGFGKWEGAQVSWTVLYDEVIFTIEGCFELTANGKKYLINPGQMIWIPKGTELIYSGYALFGYVVYPANWKELNDLNTIKS